MLTDLSWLDAGNAFPPPSEKARLERYADNEALFAGEHAAVWKDSFDRLARLSAKATRDISTVLNYHQLVSKKTADFICSEPPTIESEADIAQLEKTLDAQRFFQKLYEAFVDVSRFGDAVLKIVDKRLSVVSARHWYPIVDSRDLKHITQDVIAYPLDFDSSGNARRLHVEIHSAGSVETRSYLLKRNESKTGYEIGALEAAPTVQKTLLTRSAVFVLSNVTHSGSLFGVDDYVVFNSIVEKILWRLHCADTILDKHSEPSMSGPLSALDFDERTGLYLFKAGNYFPRDSATDVDVNYITWDGNLESNFKEIELLLNQLYILSEMGAAFLEGGGEGAASSGTALKLRLVSPRIKAQRLVGINNSTVCDLIACIAQVNGVNAGVQDISLTWHDGLPDDDVEDANRRNVETGGKPTKSQYSAIKERGLSDEETEAELEQIRLEAAANSANVLSAVDALSEEELGDES